MKPLDTWREAFSDDELLGHVMRGESWRPHHVIAMAAFGEFLTEEECGIFKRFTDRDYTPGHPVSELYLVAGRRTGKTVTMGGVASYLAACCDWSDVLTRGETGVLLCLAQDQRVATQLLTYV